MYLGLGREQGRKVWGSPVTHPLRYRKQCVWESAGLSCFSFAEKAVTAPFKHTSQSTRQL